MVEAMERRARMLGDRYRLIRPLGEGGMGVVYLAEQQPLGRAVVVKLVKSQHDDELIQRFEKEARIVSWLSHPHIVSVFDYGETADGELYLVMEQLKGCSLREELKARGPGRAWAVRIIEQIALALDAAHGEGIIHRDLTPNNIFIVDQGPLHDYVKVLDFGLAKHFEASPDGESMTRTGQLVGTPAYMSPEQADGERADWRSDIYSLGVIWYQLITGTNPFRADSAMKTLLRHLDHRPPTPTELGFDIDPAHERLLCRMLAKDPELRPTARQVWEVVHGAWSSSIPTTEPIDEAARAKEPRQRNARAKTAKNGFLAAAASVLALLVVSSLTQGHRAVATEEHPAPVDTREIGWVSRPNTDERLVELGRVLYHSDALSGHDRSCASCHPVSQWGTTHESVTWMGLKPAPMNTPTTFNASISYRQTWEAKVEELPKIIDVPLFNPGLMNGGSWDDVIARLRADSTTSQAFAAAGVEPKPDAVRSAIAEYLRWLTPVDSEFDMALKNKRQLNPQAKRGFERFKQLGCVSCHQGRGVGGNMTARFGVMTDQPFAGRGRCTEGRRGFCRSDAGCVEQGVCDLDGDEVRKKDLGRYPDDPQRHFMFKVPSLRNVAMTAPYFHDGSAATLDEAIRVMGELQLGVKLSEPTVQEIKAFLTSLTGVQHQ